MDNTIGSVDGGRSEWSQSLLSGKCRSVQTESDFGVSLNDDNTRTTDVK
jgi:hypothetical protein